MVMEANGVYLQWNQSFKIFIEIVVLVSKEFKNILLQGSY